MPSIASSGASISNCAQLATPALLDVSYGRPSKEIFTRLDFSVPQSRVALLQNIVGLNFGELRKGEVDDEFCVMGRATEVDDPAVRAQVAAAYHHPVQEQWILFALDVERCLHAKYRYRGDWPPTYTKWIDQSLREG